MLEVQREENQIQFSAFSNALALRVGVRLAEAATEAGQAVTIDIMRGEQQLFHHALEGTSADNDGWLQSRGRYWLLLGVQVLLAALRTAWVFRIEGNEVRRLRKCLARIARPVHGARAPVAHQQERLLLVEALREQVN